VKKYFYIFLFLTACLSQVKSNTEKTCIHSSCEVIKKYDSSVEGFHYQLEEKAFSLPKGKKKRGVASSPAFIPRTFQKDIIFAISEPYFQPNKQFSSILFWGLGKRGPPAVI
jgi:hypothetical protein